MSFDIIASFRNSLFQVYIKRHRLNIVVTNYEQDFNNNNNLIIICNVRNVIIIFTVIICASLRLHVI